MIAEAMLILMLFIVILVTVSILIFSFVFFCGPPYMPTKRKQCLYALSLLNLKQNELLYDLGCGDGIMLLEAARSGLNAVGIEINPILYCIAKWRTRHYRTQVEVRWGNFWSVDLSRAHGVYVFLIDPYMKKFQKLMQRVHVLHTIKVVSFNFKLPHVAPIKIDNALYLYHF